MKPFVVMAKPVGPVCNMACTYCYYLAGIDHYPGQHLFRMTDEVLESFIRQYMAASPGPTIQFVWHGGEPTLAGLDYYRKAVALQQRYLPSGWTCWNNLQTNGLLLDNDWCSFLAEHHFDVGLSIDGPAVLHDTFRLDRRGEGTHARAAEAIRRLQAHGIQPDLLCTVTAATAREPLAVYRALRDFETGWIQFIPIVRHTDEGQITPDSVSGEAYGRFLCRIFDEWSQHDIGRLNVQFFAELMLVWSGNTANVCWMAPTCGRVPVVEHDGSVYACDHFVKNACRIGDLTTTSLGELVESAPQRRFGTDKQDRLPGQCRACSWLSVCQGGCPKDRIATTADGEPGLNCLCDGLRRFYAHAENPMKRIIELMKIGQSADVIMAERRTAQAARWQGIGRNDPCPCGSGRKAKSCCWPERSN